MAAIMGNDLCPDWWPTSADQVERLLEFPEFKSQTYDIHHFCPVCGRRFSNLLAPSEYGQSPLQICSNPGCEGKGKRFRREGSALVPTQVAYYKKPARIFEKLARSREVMEVLAKERERREEKMKTLYEQHSMNSTAAQSNLRALLACYVRCMCALRICMLIQTQLIAHASHSRWYVPHMYNIFVL